MKVDPYELAKALNAHFPPIDFTRKDPEPYAAIFQNGVFHAFLSPYGWIEWHGMGEHPGLCFAMLDVLERNGIWASFFRTHHNDGAYYCEQFGEGSNLPPQKTRTAAVAAYLIDMHAAGLLNKEVR